VKSQVMAVAADETIFRSVKLGRADVAKTICIDRPGKCFEFLDGGGLWWLGLGLRLGLRRGFARTSTEEFGLETSKSFAAFDTPLR